LLEDLGIDGGERGRRPAIGTTIHGTEPVHAV